MSLAPSESAPAGVPAAAAGLPAGRGGHRRPGRVAGSGRARTGRRRLLTRASVPYLLIMPAVLG
ncbi:sugar ABC transporter permease, partial [Streptomyces sp. NPDC058548]